jgi:hypothetical protein
MKVLAKEPQHDAIIMTMDNDLSLMKKVVDGDIETVDLTEINGDKIVILCNENGKLLELPVNLQVNKVSVRGTILICRQGKTGYKSLTNKQIEYLLQKLKIKKTANDTGISSAAKENIFDFILTQWKGNVKTCLH